MEAIKEIQLSENRVFKMYSDEHRDSPREWDNLGTLACFHRRYNLGDSNVPFCSSEFSSWAEMENHIWNDLDAAVVLPIYMYDHGGITISTAPFSCPWDSGQIGFIYVTKEKVREQSRVKRIGRSLLDKVTTALENEVIIYDQYLTGDVYGFEIVSVETCDQNHKHEKLEDSCYGFYGSDIDKNGMLDHISKEDAEIILGQL